MSYIQDFYDSYERIFGKQTRINDSGLIFFDQFYKRFANADDDIKKAFENTDMERQKRMLKKSLLYCVSFTLSDKSLEHMKGIGEIHDKNHLNINPKVYDTWLECMIATVKEFDPEFNSRVDLGWRLAFSQGITMMKYMHSAC